MNCRLPSEAWAKEGRDVRPLGPTPTQSGMPLRGHEKLRFAPDLRPTHPPLRFAVSPPGGLTWVLAHPRNECPRESGDPFHRGASNKNGQGKVRGGQPDPFRASHWIKEQD